MSSITSWKHTVQAVLSNKNFRKKKGKENEMEINGRRPKRWKRGEEEKRDGRSLCGRGRSRCGGKEKTKKGRMRCGRKDEKEGEGEEKKEEKEEQKMEKATQEMRRPL